MLTKTKNIRKKSKKKISKIKKKKVWEYGSGEAATKIWNKIHAVNSEIIDATDGRTDGRTTDEFRFHELCWHSQAELKITPFWRKYIILGTFIV